MRHVKTFAGWLGLIISAVILFVGVFGAVTIWRLSQEPVSLHHITPYVVERLNRSMGENRLSVGDMIVRWQGWDEKFDLRLRDVAIFAAGGKELLHVPEADVVFSSTALFDGVLALRELNLIGPRIRLERSADGKIDIGYDSSDIDLTETGNAAPTGTVTGAGTPTETVYEKGRGPSVSIDLPEHPDAPSPDVSGGTATVPEPAQPASGINENEAEAGVESAGRILHDVVGILSGERKDFPAAAYFESFGVIDADLQVRDEKLGVVWAAPQADILLSRSDLGVAAEASLQVSAGGLSTRVRVSGDYRIQTGEIDLQARLGEVELSDLVSISDMFEKLRDAYVPVSGTISVKYDADGVVIAANTDLVVGSGVVSLPAEMRATYRVTEGRIVTSYVPGRVSFDNVSLNVGDATVKLQGAVLDPFADWVADLDMVATDVPTDDLDRLWPETIGVDARDWVVTNLSDGIVHQATLHTELHQDATGEVVLDALGGQMTMSGITVHYLGEMPDVVDAAGRAEFDETSFSIFVDRGVADGLQVNDASIIFSRLDEDIPSADIEIVAQGSVRKALELIEAEPLGFATRLGIDPAQISGEQATRVRLHFPLLRAVTFDDVEVAAASRIENANVKKAFRNLDVVDGTFELQVNTKGLDLNGQATVGAGKTDIKWVESFEEDAAVRSQYILSGDLDLAELASVDLDADPYLSGMAKGQLGIKVLPDRVEVAGDVDLGDVAIALEDVDYRKEPGPAAHAAFDLVVGSDGGGQVRSFVVSAPEVEARGRGRWRGGNRIDDKWEIEIADGRFRQNTGLNGSARLGNDDRMVVDLQGTQFDLRPLVEPDRQSPETPETDAQAVERQLSVTLDGKNFLLKGDDPVMNDGRVTFNQQGLAKEVEITARQIIATPWIVDDGEDSATPKPAGGPSSGGIGQRESRSGGMTDIFLNIDQMVMANGELLDQVKGSIHMVGEEWDRVVLNGTLGDRANIFAQVIRENFNSRKVSLTSEDAGKFLRAVDMYENLLGGDLVIEGVVDESDFSQPFSGTVRIGGFRVVNAPIAARVLGAASLTGLNDVLQGNGIAFDELTGEFTYVNDVLSLTKVAANGSAVGVTANGSIDLAKSEIRLAGSIVPIYALNSALGAIPILGDILVGEEGGGIFAPTYTIEGDLADPEVVVNPLSTFVPGVFRNLITGAEPG